MKSNINRRKEIFKGILPEDGTKEYFERIDELEKNVQANPGLNEYAKKNWTKVINSLFAQYQSNCGFLTEKSLRHFLNEFNQRAWRYGLRSMPSMFNIMEAFFIYRRPEVYFELIEEENYLVSLFDFIDFVTSNAFQNRKTLIYENLTPDIIYNFNVNHNFDKIKFTTDNGSEFVIAGISIIRRADEVTVLLTTGRRKTNEDGLQKQDIFASSIKNNNKTKLLKDYSEHYKGKDIDFEFLDDEKQYIKVLIGCRIDLETLTIDARYIAEETNISFTIWSDETDGYVNKKGEFISESLKQIHERGIEMIDKFGSIFEVVNFSLYLPYYFNLHEDSIIEETLDTNFKSAFSSPLTKRKFKDVFGNKSSNKPLYSLDIQNLFSPNSINFRDDLFKVQTSGYWKKLSLDEVGLDKKGKPVHGRTWVNQSLSWFEASEKDLIVEKDEKLFEGDNAGFIYVLRNPIMDKNIFKIGLTRYDVKERVNQLSNTSVPDKFFMVQRWNVKNCVKAEKEIHNKLSSYRVDPRREFFQIDYDKAIEVIKNVISQINSEDGNT